MVGESLLLSVSTKFMLTSKAVIGVFADEYRAFDGLFHDLEHDILEFLELVFEILRCDNERPNIFHCGYKGAYRSVSLYLILDELSYGLMMLFKEPSSQKPIPCIMHWRSTKRC